MLRWFRKPDPETVANDKIRAALKREGDDGTAPRHVIHYVHPLDGGEINASAVLDYLVASGFEVDPNKAQSGYFAEETREVASRDFDAHCGALRHAMGQWNWKYDGFECAVTPKKG